jgi:hypothetical protein
VICKTVLRVFMPPGNLAADLVGAGESDDRMMTRTLVNMLVWNFAVVWAVVALW